MTLPLPQPALTTLQLKPDYSGGAEIDCLIIGAVFGTNRNKGTVSEFILALAVPPEDPMQVSVGRVANLQNW